MEGGKGRSRGREDGKGAHNKETEQRWRKEGKEGKEGREGKEEMTCESVGEGRRRRSSCSR